MNVVVLMSTFNGERYIKEQIDSILNQEGVNVFLMIRDDGSTDNTVEILKDYSKKNENIVAIKGKNIGVGNSFMQLLYKSTEAEYYAFADQDDVWKKDKLIRGIEKISSIDSDHAVCYASNQTVVNQNMEIQGLRYDYYPSTEIAGIINQNPFSGCTMILNKVLRDMLIDKDKRPSADFFCVRIHDAWIAMYACCVGKIIYDENSYILYRQHHDNVVGAGKKSVLGKAKGYMEYLWDSDKKNYRSKAAHQLLMSIDKSLMSEKTRKILQLFDNLGTVSGRMEFCKSDMIFENVKNKNLFRLKAMLGLL